MNGLLFQFSTEVKLPAWGFEQQEVTCASSGRHDLTLWYVENNSNPLLPEDTKRISYKPASFISKFIESHKKMWHINKNLVEPHVYESQPTSWPFLLRGISYWGENNRNVYLLGNAIVWWAVTAFIGIFGLICLFTQLSLKLENQFEGFQGC
ncbi:ANL_HP_G0146510.mRNA.1.CDS.1 [Saccharomyces cerevisiae]|nr:ANL_HP_G0146510.mRNA.1.CDS.1 [Saccharomyces cerevisiae]CAI7009166.1 ANL_HP_G0146510.mRNA.1.CDS.1 [Saccharomyces cerevisiae]